MKNLIFIISQPRSGSTLLQKILENHPSINSTDETWLSLLLFSLLDQEIKIDADYDFSLARMAVDNFLVTAEFKEEFERSLAQLIKNAYRKSAGDAVYFLEKTPRNYFVLKSLHRHFPNAKFILLTRNPSAVVSSLLASWHDNNLEALKMHYYDLMKAPQEIFAFSQTHPDFFHVIYEDLVSEPQQMLEKLSLFLSLDTPLSNTYTLSKNVSFGDNIGIHQFNQAESSSIEKWKNDAPEQLCVYYWYLQQLPDDVKQFFFANEDRLKDTLTYLETFKNILSAETIYSLLAEPKSIKDQLIEKETVIQEKELALLTLYAELEENRHLSKPYGFLKSAWKRFSILQRLKGKK